MLFKAFIRNMPKQIPASRDNIVIEFLLRFYAFLEIKIAIEQFQVCV